MILYDLIGKNNTHFSPNSWRVRMALGHKGLAYEVEPTVFTRIKDIAPGRKLTIPTIRDGDKLITDSWVIVEHLDQCYPSTPRLIDPDCGGPLTRFFQHWAQTAIHAGISELILLDVHDQLDAADQAYFRASREKRYGKSLEQVQSGREARIDAFRKRLQPLRLAVSDVPYVGGKQPCYADYLAFGGFQWARVTSPVKLLANDDPVHAWFERCLDLHGGIGRLEPAFANN
ncbi:MAG: glutathione S-transferase family protein [Pseudomonadota bacterium]